MKARSRLQAGLAAVAAAMSLVVLRPVPAVALLGDCNVIQHIFVRSTNIAGDVHGDTNRLLVSSRTLDTDCKGEAISTAHLTPNNFGSVNPSWVEVGWFRIRNADGTIDLCEFWEKGVDGNITFFHNNCGNFTNLTLGNFAEFRLKNVSGTTDWDVFINYLDGNGFGMPKHTFSTTYDFSIASGETQKKGNGTAMDDDQRNLQVFAQNAWQDWLNANCVVDEAPGWSWHKQTTNSYTVDQVANAC